MQLPNRKTPIARCEAVSRYTQRALKRYAVQFGGPPQLAGRLEGLATALGGATGALMTAQAAYRAAVIALIDARVDLRLMDLHCDDVVRSVKRAADDAGQGATVFPEGVTAVIRPVGQAQVDALRAIEGRIAAATKWEQRETQRARIVATHDAYKAALEGRKSSMLAAADNKVQRDTALEDFLDTFAAVGGAIKELFPRDKPRQEVFFDEVRPPRRSDNDDDDDDDDQA